ncbi:hypothetical protein FFM54_36275 [Burkholderia pseudomallei]|nr:hypothetical protein FFM54_36275 [Burkholderia pseudomallei]
MKDFGLEFREKYGHPNIVVPMEDDLEFGAQAVLSYFEDQIRQGTIFREGETVQIGWSILMLKAGAGETLEAWEPEFSPMPISWIRGANTTYRHLMMQRKFVLSSEWNRTIRPFGKQRSSPPNSRAQMSFLWYENPRMRQIPDGCLLRDAALIRTPNFVRCLKWQLNLGELFHFWRCQSVRP